jgi:hypothetical protein
MKTQVTNMRALKAAVLIFLVGFLYKKVYQPLPDDFEQPWKYRLICFGADVANYFVKINGLSSINIYIFAITHSIIFKRVIILKRWA